MAFHPGTAFLSAGAPANSGGGGMPGRVVFVVILVIVVVTLWRLFGRKGPATATRDGRAAGPAVYWFPRFMRPWVNRWFQRSGWPEPYDGSLNKIPRSQRL